MPGHSRQGWDTGRWWSLPRPGKPVPDTQPWSQPLVGTQNDVAFWVQYKGSPDGAGLPGKGTVSPPQISAPSHHCKQRAKEHGKHSGRDATGKAIHCGDIAASPQEQRGPSLSPREPLPSASTQSLFPAVTAASPDQGGAGEPRALLRARRDSTRTWPPAAASYQPLLQPTRPGLLLTSPHTRLDTRVHPPLAGFRGSVQHLPKRVSNRKSKLGSMMRN